MKPVRLASLCVAAASVLLPAHAVFAQDKTQDQAQSRQTIRDQDIYGYQMMTSEERNEYRQKMRAAGTAEERERVRAEHHEQMKERAQARGMTLPDQPRAGRGPGGASAGGGMGPGGGGMGPGGGGMGPGGGGMGPGGGAGGGR